MDNSDFGQGMKSPQVNKGRAFAMSSGKDSVRESVYIILMTQRGERWLEPNFGSGLMSYTFMDTSITMLSLMASELRNTILEQEPRISDVNIDIEPNVKDDCLIINIQYVIAETNTPDNLVFPFYLNASGEGISDETEE